MAAGFSAPGMRSFLARSWRWKTRIRLRHSGVAASSRTEARSRREGSLDGLADPERDGVQGHRQGGIMAAGFFLHAAARDGGGECGGEAVEDGERMGR